jgi:hypothetical protein
MEEVRVYRMTLSTRGYSLGKHAWSYEAHFTALLPGNVHNVREKLRAYFVPYFQRLVQERYGEDVPLVKIRGEFEREEPALSPSADITVEPYEITYRGRMHYATAVPIRRLPSDIIAYDPDRYSDEGEDEESDGDDESEEDDWGEDEEDEWDENDEDHDDDDDEYEDEY